MADPQRLSSAARDIVLTGPNVLSILSYWEVIIKAAEGKIGMVAHPSVWWETALIDLAATPLPLKSGHLAEIIHLPPIHKHPFDRALIAQAIFEDLTLVTADRAIAAYAGPRLRIVQ